MKVKMDLTSGVANSHGLQINSRINRPKEEMKRNDGRGEEFGITQSKMEAMESQRYVPGGSKLKNHV